VTTAESCRGYWSQEAADLCATLTPRQTEVLVLLAKGLTAQDIAVALGLKYFTAVQHKHAIYRALGVGTLAESSVIATKAGLV
jgi:DNA-binding NarL/FixJ family response regulator